MAAGSSSEVITLLDPTILILCLYHVDVAFNQEDSQVVMIIPIL